MVGVVMKNVRAHVNISGRVQGVYYRMETKRTAEKYGVKGWVRNKADGSVDAVFEGDEKSVHSTIAWCRQGPSNAMVRNVEVQWEDYAEEFETFDITF
jgi:acylphosphatase